MPDLDDGIRRELERLARPGDSRGAFDRVSRAKRRIRVMRRVQVGAVVVAVVAGTAGAVVALDRAFRPTPGSRPQVGPTGTSPSPAMDRCPDATELRGDVPEGYGPFVPGSGDVVGNGQISPIWIFKDAARPLACRFLLVVESSDGAYVFPIPSFQWLLAEPSILMTAEIDGQPGEEVVLDFGGPGHPHRSGQVFTYEPGAAPDGGGVVVPMRLEPPQGGEDILLPLGGEFAAGVDCVPEPGTIVVSVGGLAAGGDTHYDITRTLYVAEQGRFVEVSSESFTVPVGEEDDRWPELADDPFQSCPSG